MAEDEALTGEVLPAAAGQIVVARVYPDGRVIGRLEWADGFWTNQVFVSEDALRADAEENGWEVVDNR